MVYFNTILFCGIFFHFVLRSESDLLEGILLGSALQEDDSDESEILVIRIPKQSVKNSKRSDKTRLTTTTSTENPMTSASYTTTINYGIPLDTMEISSVRTVNSTSITAIKSPEYSTQTSVTTENICGANQTYTHCMNECGNRCTDRTDNKLCPIHCFGFGCTCDTDFVRDVRTDRCVKPIDCPKPMKCSMGERFIACGGCGPTCEQPIPVCSRICRVEGGCDCIRGLVRNNHGKCVPLSLCQSSNSTTTLKTKSKPNPKSKTTKIKQKTVANKLITEQANNTSNNNNNKLVNNLGSNFGNRLGNSVEKNNVLRQLFDNLNDKHYIFN